MNKLHRMKQLAHKALTFIKADEKLGMAAYTKELQMSHRENTPNYCSELKSYSLASKHRSALMTNSNLIIIFRSNKAARHCFYHIKTQINH